MNIYQSLKELVKEEIKKSISELNQKYGINNLQGYALGTDDDVSTLYHVACTHAWVEKQKIEQNYDDIGYDFVEWTESGNDDLFLSISDLLRIEASKRKVFWGKHRDKRFHALSQALSEISEEKLFYRNTFLCVGSTDPSDHMSKLELKWVKAMNNAENITNYSKALGS